MQTGENDCGGRTKAYFNTVKNLPDLKEGYSSVCCIQPAL